MLTQTAARQLVTDPGGRVTGVECLSLRDAPAGARLAHRVLHRWSVKPYLYVPKLGRILHRPVALAGAPLRAPLRIGAARGVILAAGGFAASRAMMRAHAPNARGGLPLATPGDDGSGIRLGTQAGGATAFLDRVSVWRFLSPPPALLAGVLVDRAGQRVCDESRYGAALGDAILRHGGRAWLLVDHATRAAGPPPGPRFDPVVPAPAGLVPAEPGRGPRPRRGRGRGPGRRRSGRPGRHRSRLQRRQPRPGAHPRARRTRPAASPPPCAARRTSRRTT